MSNIRDDNEIMKLLSDIDEEFIDDILELPQEPQKNTETAKASKKSIFMRFAIPIWACLAIAAIIFIPVWNKIPSHGENDLIITTTVPFEEREECERYIEEKYSYYIKEGCTYSFHSVDLDFDGSYETVLFPSYDICPIFFFSKINNNNVFMGMLDGENGDYPLNNFGDLKLYDTNGEQYYYYYYFNKKGDYEEKGAAALRFDNSGVRAEGLLSYGSYCGTEDMQPTNYLDKYFRKGGKDTSFEEFEKLWSEYRQLPPIQYEEYWDGGEITLDNAQYLSDLLEANTVPNIDGSAVQGKWENSKFNFERTADKVILAQKDCGKYTISVLGYKVRTDNAFDDSFLFSHKMKLVLSDENGNVLSVQDVHEPWVWTNSERAFYLHHMDDCLDVADAGKYQVVLFRCPDGSHLTEQTMLFGVKEGKLYPCTNIGLGENEREFFTPYISGAFTIEEKTINYGAGLDDDIEVVEVILKETLTRTMYTFQFDLIYDNEITYIINKADILPEYSGEELNISEYTPIEEIKIPTLGIEGYSFKEMADYIISSSAKKVLFAQQTVNGEDSVYNLYLVGVFVRYDSSDKVNFGNLRTAVFKDGVYLGSVINSSCYANSYIQVEKYEELLAKGYYCEEYDALILVRANPVYNGYYGNDCFGAVMNNRLYTNLDCAWMNITDQPAPAWTEGEEPYSYSDIEVKGNEVSCGFYTYRFRFDGGGFGLGQYDIFTCWREEKPE